MVGNLHARRVLTISSLTCPIGDDGVLKYFLKFWAGLLGGGYLVVIDGYAGGQGLSGWVKRAWATENLTS